MIDYIIMHSKNLGKEKRKNLKRQKWRKKGIEEMENLEIMEIKGDEKQRKYDKRKKRNGKIKINHMILKSII